MLTRVHIENFRSLEHVSVELGTRNLLIGYNGAGKSSILDILGVLRDLVIEGERCESLLDISSIPRWQRNGVPRLHVQRFGLDVTSPLGILKYVVAVEQDEKLGRSRVVSEALESETGPLFGFEQGKVQLYTDRHKKGPEYTFDWNRSALGSVVAGPSNEALTTFKSFLRALQCLRIDAPRMSGHSEREESRLASDFSNFASWYRRAAVADAAEAAAFLTEIRSVIAGMKSLDLHELGQGIMILRAVFDRPRKKRDGDDALGKRMRQYWLEFRELSDGQRALIGLYALTHFLVREGTTVCIDEPDNYVALAEIQPWLDGLQDRTDDVGTQLLIASHHPELINPLAPEGGILVERDGAGPTTVRPYTADLGSQLKPSDRIARGWERE